MLDIIFGNCVLDNCDLYQWASLWFSIVDAFATSDGAASIAAKFSSKVEGEMQKTIEACNRRLRLIFADGDSNLRSAFIDGARFFIPATVTF